MLKSRFSIILSALSLIVLTVAIFALATSSPPPKRNFRTHLKGDEEAPPRETLAQGQAIFQLSEDGSEIHYQVNVANIENVIMGHIHVGPPGVNGPVVVWLYPVGGPPPAPSAGGRFDGVLAEGTFTADDLTGPLAGMTLDDLMAEVRAGNTYVNVHTDDGVAPFGTGPGDFIGGEVRGQI